MLVVYTIERRADRAIVLTLYIHLRPEAGEIVVEVIHLLLERGEVRRHLLEFTVF
jgi:hypothetical protein